MTERILCAAIYVDDGERHQRTFAYPQTGLLFCGLRHPDCFASMNAWKDGLDEDQILAIDLIGEHQLRGRNQGFLTSTGRFVDREEAAAIALREGQIDRVLRCLTSEDLY